MDKPKYDADFLERLEPLFLHTQSAIVGWDRRLRISYWSQSACKLFRLEARDMLGKTVADGTLVHEADRNAVIERSERLELGQQREHVNINRNTRGDGTSIVCRWTRAIEQDDDRLAIVSIVEDITREYAARDSILESEARFRALFADNPDPILILDEDGFVTEVNEAARKIVGLSFSDSIGHHFREFIPAERIAEHEGYFRNARSGLTQEYDVTIFDNLLNPRYLSVKTVPLFDGGSFAGVYSILHDDTDRRTEQEALAATERERYESTRRLRSLFEANPDGVIAVDLHGTVTAANAAAVRIGGYDRERFLGRSFGDFVADEYRTTARRRFIMATVGKGSSFALRCLRADASLVSLDTTLIPQYSGKDIIGVYAVLQDITLQIEAQEQARVQSRRVRDLYGIASSASEPLDGMVETLQLGCRVFGARFGAIIDTSTHNPTIEAATSTSLGAPIEQELFAIARRIAEAGNDTPPTIQSDAIAVPIDVGGIRTGAAIFTQLDGQRSFTNTDMEFLGLIVTLLQTFIERGRVREHLQRRAYVDALTGLPNGSGFRDRLRGALEAAPLRMQRVAVLFFGLDRFKDINETLGHRLGDQLLQAVATRIEGLFSNLGTLARMGGDEFALAIEDAGSNDRLRDIAEQTIAALEEPFVVDDIEQFLSASIGIAVYPEDGTDGDILIKNADIAMSRAKDRGRGGFYFYNATLESPILMRLAQERSLRHALEKNEFVVHYQPQIDLTDGHIVGVEALVRWQHPATGLIEPGRFIPSAEISGLIVALGRWVLETATMQTAEWVKRFGPLRLAVNLSARQLHHRHLSREIVSALDRSGLEPALLELEITESVAMSDVAQAISIVREIKGYGVRTAVDDFGTGYSSLAYLRRFAFDVLKIDGSFIHGIGREREDETIVKTLVGMAHNLGLETIAEGIERAEQAVFLRDYGCRIAQGFLYSKALPTSEMERFLATRASAVS